MSRQTALRTEAPETAPLFKADGATLSFYATKDGKVSISYAKGQQFIISWGPQGVEGRIIDAHPRMFADLQDDSIFHARTSHRAARLGRSASIASSAAARLELGGG